MTLRLNALLERVRSSLFVVPMVFVVAGGLLGVAMVELDSRGGGGAGLPFVLTSTVGSAREVLGVVAGATITVAGIAFSVSLLVIQQAANQYSPRVVHTLFRDAFNRRVMGIALGTFTYCLMVLRTVRTAVEDDGEPIVPNVSVGVAVFLGIVAILAIVAFIDHNAHAMEISKILRRVADDTLSQVERSWPDGERRTEARDPDIPEHGGHPVPFTGSGWLQQLDEDALLELVDDGGTVRLDTAVGRYAVKGTPLCTIWPAPVDVDGAAAHAAGAITLGSVRTMQQDPSYGIRQLADVALIALSPGVNDPTTAQSAIFHLADVLRETLLRDLPPRGARDARGRTIIRAEAHTHETLVELAFDEIRRSAASMPTVGIYLLEALHLVRTSVVEGGHADRSAALERQARLVLEGARRAELLDEDAEQVTRAYERRFGGHLAPARPR